jgi:hypothetical protein
MTFLYTKASLSLYIKSLTIYPRFSLPVHYRPSLTLSNLSRLCQQKRAVFPSMNQKERSMPKHTHLTKEQINGVAGNRTQNLLHSVMLEEQC